MNVTKSTKIISASIA